MNEKLAEKAKELERADAVVRKIEGEIDSMLHSMIDSHINKSTNYSCHAEIIPLDDSASCISIGWYPGD